MIYQKQLKVSTATNKNFASGDLINFVQVDAMKLQMLAQSLPSVMRLPLLVVVSFIVLFVYLGESFWAGIGIFMITFVVNL